MNADASRAREILRPPNASNAEAKPEVVRLVLPYPVSANRYWASRAIRKRGAKRPMVITYVTDDAVAYKQDIGRLAALAGVRQPLQGTVQLTVHLFPNRPLDWARRARKDPDGWADGVRCIDLDNCLKVLLDALKGVAFGDDAWVRRIDAERMEPDEHGARVVVTIEPIVRERIAPELAL